MAMMQPGYDHLPPMPMPPSGAGGGVDAITQSTDPTALAQVVMQAIEEARQSAHLELDQQQEAAVAQVQAIVDAMLNPTPTQGLQGSPMPMRATGGGVPLVAPPPNDDSYGS